MNVTYDDYITSYDLLPVQVVRNIGAGLAAIDAVESRYDFLYRVMPENIKRPFLDVYHKSAEWTCALHTERFGHAVVGLEEATATQDERDEAIRK